ncbi:MAG: hypothetical protein KDE27_15855 [Planctomycetes bacterium]|nr:hypothetical protein [Planctomycetota bacterium]
MQQATSVALLAATLVAAVHLDAQQLEGRKWTHEKLGVELTIPEGYEVVPLQPDEQWIVAKFLCDKTYIAKDEWNTEHRPLMRVVAFTEKAKSASAAEVHEEKDGTTFIGIGAVPYQGYRDYVKRHRSGFFFSKEKEDKVAGEDCLVCEVEINKREPKLHLYSVVFRRPTFELAVEFEVLEDRIDKLERDCLRALDSVRFGEPAAAEAAVTGVGGRRTSTRLWTAFRGEWRKRSLEERYEIRKQIEREHHEAVRKKTPDDWTITESKHFLVVSHTDSKFTDIMTDGAEVFWSWCEENFGKLSDDYVRRPVMRLCKDQDEYLAYHFASSGTTGWSLFDDTFEVGSYYSTYDGTSGSNVSRVFTSILRFYLQEKDPYIIEYTPYWITWALDDYFDNAVVKGKKIDFRAEDWARDGARDMLREDKLPKLRELLELDADGYSALRKKDYRANYAAAQALRYVLGPGQRIKQFKDFLNRYFEAAIQVGEADDKKVAAADPSSAQTEEEEEALAKAEQERKKARKKAMQDKINATVLAGLGDKDWQKLEKAYAEFVKKGK